MDIKICDAIMGSGKTESAIRYINEHPDRRFVYITPYLEEAARIRAGCPEAAFVEPSNKLKEYHFTKTEHAQALICEGRNIATTHQALKRYTKEMLHNIREKKYILILDENMEMLNSYDLHPDDLNMLISGGYIIRDGDYYYKSEREYKGRLMKQVTDLFDSRGLVDSDTPEGGKVYFWKLAPELITSFDEVIIMTYMFPCQSLHHMLELNNIKYSFIGIEHPEPGVYRFTDTPGYVPEYVSSIKDKLHLLDHPKLNDIGEDRCALSLSWLGNEDNLEAARLNASNYFKNICAKVPSADKLWSTFKDYQKGMQGNGYRKAFLPFNTRATNEYRNCTHLAYLANIFMNVPEKLFYKKHDINVNEDMYALSTIVQWIWRSAIRDGNEILLYLPSSRMRGLLSDWMDGLEKGAA